MIVRTDAIVLRSFDYGETSRIVTLFTRERGRVAVMAKGARLPRSRFGASLQPMAHTQVVFYYKSTRTLHTLSESAHVELFSGLGRDLDKLGVGLRVVELVNALLQDEQPNPHVYNLVLEVLRRLDGAARTPEALLPAFQLRLAALLGFAPTIEREAVEALPESGGVMLLDTGAVVPLHAAAGPFHRATRSALRAYAVCARADLEAVGRMRLAPGVRRELEALVEAFVRFHVEDAYPTRSETVLSQLQPPDA